MVSGNLSVNRRFAQSSFAMKRFGSGAMVDGVVGSGVGIIVGVDGDGGLVG